MIGDLNETIKQLLVERIPLDPREVEIAFDPPEHEWSAAVSTPTINCYLWHIQENHHLRANDWERQPVNGRGGIVRKRMPFRIEMHYLITVWATAIEDEQRLLWRILSALMRYQILPKEMLKGELAASEWPVPIAVVQPDGYFKNPSDFWTGFENFIKPSITAVFTLPLDPELVVTAPLVFTHETRLRRMDRSGRIKDHYSMGGTVRTGPGDQDGLAGVVVRIRERGVDYTTDADGRFRFDNLPPGTYTLEAHRNGQPTARQVTLPGPDYDMVLGDDT